MAKIDYSKMTKKKANLSLQDSVKSDLIVGKINGEKIIQLSTYNKDGDHITQTIQFDEDTIKALYAYTLIK